MNLLAPRAALPLAFDWLFLGPELSWSVAGFCAHHIHFTPVTQGLLQRSRASCLALRPCCLLHRSCGQCRPPAGSRSPLAFTTSNRPTGMNGQPLDVSALSGCRVARANRASTHIFSSAMNNDVPALLANRRTLLVPPLWDLLCRINVRVLS